MTSEKLGLTRLERYFLSNQLRILEALYPDDAEDFAIQREAVERGYEMIWPLGMDFIYDDSDSMSIEESREVWDTLDMFDAVDRGIKAHGRSVAADLPFTKFMGYDGNNETKFMAFAAFTVERLHRFQYVPMAKQGYWNSHMPMREVYGRMLEAWRTIPRERRLDPTYDELLTIIEAARAR